MMYPYEMKKDYPKFNIDRKLSIRYNVQKWDTKNKSWYDSNYNLGSYIFNKTTKGKVSIGNMRIFL
jgi:uncharacterized phage-like protein YoqJ